MILKYYFEESVWPVEIIVSPTAKDLADYMNQTNCVSPKSQYSKDYLKAIVDLMEYGFLEDDILEEDDDLVEFLKDRYVDKAREEL